MNYDLTLRDVLLAYRNGMFPMAEGRHVPGIHWYRPHMRGQLSIAGLHIPARLKRTVRQAPYEIRVNQAFDQVIQNCAAQASNRPETWINDTIINIFSALHQAGYAHSIEAYDRRNDTLVGGLYGLALGGAFMGESMFSRATDASKICLVHLCARLWRGGFTVLDTQFTNPHLEQFGIYEISDEDYTAALEKALMIKADFVQGQETECRIIAGYPPLT